MCHASELAIDYLDDRRSNHSYIWFFLYSSFPLIFFKQVFTYIHQNEIFSAFLIFSLFSSNSSNINGITGFGEEDSQSVFNFMKVAVDMAKSGGGLVTIYFLCLLNLLL